MNWEQIYKKYPKAIKKYFDFRFKNVKIEISFNIRNLYDFFDEQEITINVWFASYQFIFEILTVNDIYNDYEEEGNGYNSRKEAEQAAFEKAFEILENGQ